jgi:uroporphyrinogen decarboxylase
LQAAQWLELLPECFLDYLKMQVRAGATQIMIFDSWAFLCPKSSWGSDVYQYTLKLMRSFKQAYPDIPLIYYPRGRAVDALNIPEQPFDVIACDSNTDMLSLQNKTTKVLQGNFRADLLLESKECIEQAVEEYFSKLSKPVIVNLGQGINPLTPVDHVDAFVKAVRYQEKIFSVNHSNH